MDVKFLTFVDKAGVKTRRFHYPAIDGATLRFIPRLAHWNENRLEA